MTLPPFANEPILELRRAGPRQALLDALAAVDASLPRRVPVLIGAEERHGGELVSTDPGEPERVVAVAARATPEEAGAAIAAAT
ncbi:MAG TPA: hypothetical protein VFR97_01290, partial [Capillimicrobium sp.]|nr:hypothetical protein [Capillimicrobium sp.]